MKNLFYRFYFFAFVFVGILHAESLIKVSRVSVGYNQCNAGDPRVIVKTGDLVLVDRVLKDSASILVDKIIPVHELPLTGYILCGSNTLDLDEVRVKKENIREKIDLGNKVSVFLEAVQVRGADRQISSSAVSRVNFKKRLSEQVNKRKNYRKK